MAILVMSYRYMISFVGFSDFSICKCNIRLMVSHTARFARSKNTQQIKTTRTKNIVVKQTTGT